MQGKMAEREKREMVERVRAAVKDRAVWFALLYRSFSSAFPAPEVQRLCREAIARFGRMKAAKDPSPFGHRTWVEKHVEKGSDLVFDSRVEPGEECSRQEMRYCPLVEAWKEMGCSPGEIDLFCDIAMEGDRGRAEAHGVSMELNERIGRGDPYCRLVIR